METLTIVIRDPDLIEKINNRASWFKEPNHDELVERILRDRFPVNPGRPVSDNTDRLKEDVKALQKDNATLNAEFDKSEATRKALEKAHAKMKADYELVSRRHKLAMALIHVYTGEELREV